MGDLGLGEIVLIVAVLAVLLYLRKLASRGDG